MQPLPTDFAGNVPERLILDEFVEFFLGAVGRELNDVVPGKREIVAVKWPQCFQLLPFTVPLSIILDRVNF